MIQREAAIHEIECDAESADSASTRIILIRHGRPALPIAPRTCQRGFRDYIDAYEEAGLDPNDAPPEELQDLVAELDAIFTSERRRAHESARALAPNAELIIDPLFAEAPLAGPSIPLLRMRVAKWAVVARVLWYAGHHPNIENYRKAKHRASAAADILVDRARIERTTALIAHGYFNFLIGRELNRRGFRKSGTHRARFWNAVLYDKHVA
ncbi:MAG TPA: histidine phosphatase family protein [Rhizomicrobium sp.]|jgi:broad specificity phosphatase PhoE|nr:histidine phosphatase family protein [Rhizomicrobium sp.]